MDQMDWANEATIAWLREPGNADAKSLLLASHILNSQSIWIDRVSQREYVPDAFILRAVEAMPAINEANRKGFQEILAGDLDREIDYRMIDGTPRRSRIEDMLMHVFTHGFHHHGQMAANASARGLRFPNVSFIGFTRLNPSPESPA